MKILLVGGTGLAGGHAALWLAQYGHEVVIAARNPPQEGTPLAQLPMLRGSYFHGDFTVNALSGFDALIFAAGNDIRHVPPGADQVEHWQRANVEGVPDFFRMAREAGIGRAVYVGSFYPQVAPELTKTSAYVKSRMLADEGVRALDRPGFKVCSVNAPFIVGTAPGVMVRTFAKHAAYALGRLPKIPVFAMPGGVNFISTTSLTAAIVGAMNQGEPGKAYLVGDENLSFQEYFGEMFLAAGRNEPVPILNQEHPLFPDSALYAGRGSFIYYEPDANETMLLGYPRSDVKRALREMLEFYRNT